MPDIAELYDDLWETGNEGVITSEEWRRVYTAIRDLSPEEYAAQGCDRYFTFEDDVEVEQCREMIFQWMDAEDEKEQLHADKMRLEAEVARLKALNKKLEEDNTELLYAPGALEALRAKESFERSLAQQRQQGAAAATTRVLRSQKRKTPPSE